MRRSETKFNVSSYSACHSEMETESAADYVSESTRTTLSSQSPPHSEFGAEIIKLAHMFSESQKVVKSWENTRTISNIR